MAGDSKSKAGGSADKKRSDAESERMRLCWHVFPAVLATVLYITIDIYPMDLFWIIFPVSLAFTALEHLRLNRNSRAQTIFHTMFGEILRSHEQQAHCGTFYYLWGVTLTSLISPSAEAVTVGILLLAFCDPAAAVIGRHFGSRPGATQLRPGKSLAGFLGAWAVGVVVFCLFATSVRSFRGGPDWSQRPALELLGFAGAVSLAVALVETLSYFDDNLGIPIVAAVTTTVFSSLLGVGW